MEEVIKDLYDKAQKADTLEHNKHILTILLNYVKSGFNITQIESDLEEVTRKYEDAHRLFKEAESYVNTIKKVK